MNSEVRLELHELMPDKDGLRIEVVSTYEQWVLLKSQWKNLWVATDTSDPFCSYEWLDSWWSVFATERDTLQIWTVWDGQALLAALPMYRKRYGKRQAWCLYFLGTGEPRADEVATEYSDLLVVPDAAAEIVPMAIQWLLSYENWSCVELRCLLEGALLYQGLKQHASAKRCLVLSSGSRYRVPLSGEETELQLMGSSNQKRIKRSLRAIERDGGMQRLSASATGDTVEGLKGLIELNRQRQEHKKRRSAFESDLFLRFHEQVLARLMPVGQADILSYYIKDQLVAAVYVFYDKHTAYYYQSGFAAGASNKYMPLTAAHMNEARQARTAGRQYYDLMRAELPTYKAAMASDVEPLFNVFLFSSGFTRQSYSLMRKGRKVLVLSLKSVGIERR